MELTAAIAASRMDAQMRALDVVADNMANASTPGFKAERVMFSQWINRQTGAAPPPGGQTVAFAQDQATWRETQPGALNHTGNPLDLAISGDGYFTVGTPRGPRLTRDGRFGLLPNGTIADAAGNALLDVNGQPIQLSTADTRITVAGDGTVSSENGQIGKIGLVRPKNPLALSGEGGTLFRADAPTTPVDGPQLVQGAIEESNVQPVLEMTRMMDNYRQFQFLSQLVQAESDRQQTAIDKLLPEGS